MKSDYSNMSIDDLQMCLIKSKTLDKSAMLRSLIKQQKEIKRLKGEMNKGKKPIEKKSKTIVEVA